MMRRKAIAAGAVVVVLFLFTALLLFAFRKPPQEITLRHVKSIRTEDITEMSFEVKNQTADSYIFYPFEMQIRNRNAWTKFQGFDIKQFHQSPKLSPNGLASCTVNVTNLPAGALVRFGIRSQKVLVGPRGFIRRAEFDLKQRRKGGPGVWIPLNPYDKNSQVYSRPSEVVSEEFIEFGR
jgi:hypothetical protein